MDANFQPVMFDGATGGMGGGGAGGGGGPFGPGGGGGSGAGTQTFNFGNGGFPGGGGNDGMFSGMPQGGPSSGDGDFDLNEKIYATDVPKSSKYPTLKAERKYTIYASSLDGRKAQRLNIPHHET